jgi:MtN3 and saliva related transmembrane protein
MQRQSAIQQQQGAMCMYFLKTGSPTYLQWLKVFEPLMVITGIVQPLASIPSISKLYFTHSQHASGRSLTTWSIFALASLLWVIYGLLNRKPAIYLGNIIGLGDEFAHGEWHPDARRMGVLRLQVMSSSHSVYGSLHFNVK